MHKLHSYRLTIKTSPGHPQQSPKQTKTRREFLRSKNFLVSLRKIKSVKILFLRNSHRTQKIFFRESVWKIRLPFHKLCFSSNKKLRKTLMKVIESVERINQSKRLIVQSKQPLISVKLNKWRKTKCKCYQSSSRSAPWKIKSIIIFSVRFSPLSNSTGWSQRHKSLSLKRSPH